MLITFVLSVVYAYNTRERRELWKNLVIKEYEICKNTVNSLLKVDDKLGGNPVTWYEVTDFQEYVNTCGLVEVLHRGNGIPGMIKGMFPESTPR